MVGLKYDNTKTAEGRPLTREDLDAAVPDHPVYINHRGGHTSYVNSLAFKIAGVDDRTPDPPGGHFDRDASGRLIGCVRENAKDPFTTKIPSTYTRDDYREGVKIVSKMMTRVGYVCLGQMKRNDSVEAQIVALEKRAFEAWKNKDREFFWDHMRSAGGSMGGAIT